MKVITAVMKKGGAGKTSTIVPLSWIAHESGARVVDRIKRGEVR